MCLGGGGVGCDGGVGCVGVVIMVQKWGPKSRKNGPRVWAFCKIEFPGIQKPVQILTQKSSFFGNLGNRGVGVIWWVWRVWFSFFPFTVRCGLVVGSCPLGVLALLFLIFVFGWR